MQQKDQYIYIDHRFVKISGGKADVRIVSELPADPVEGTIYLVESDPEEFLDISDGITEEIKEAVRNKPEQLLRYEYKLYSPVYKSSDEEIPTYYASVQTDEEKAYGLIIDWGNLEIVEEYEVPLGGGELPSKRYQHNIVISNFKTNYNRRISFTIINDSEEEFETIEEIRLYLSSKGISNVNNKKHYIPATGLDVDFRSQDHSFEEIYLGICAEPSQTNTFWLYGYYFQGNGLYKADEGSRRLTDESLLDTVVEI